jgi:serine protease Do
MTIKKYAFKCVIMGTFLLSSPLISGTCAYQGSPFTAIAKKSIPAVVYIKNQCNGGVQEKSPEDYNDPFDFFNDRFRRFFEPPGPRMSAGSGFLISADGYIMTNRHVVNEADDLTVILNNGDQYKAKLIGSDARTDLALIKIDGKDLPFLPFGDSDHIEIAEDVIAIGSPFSLQATVTHGIISAEKRQDLHITDLEEFIQTDAPINPGNSGGPLINMKGEVIGINTALLSTSGANSGIGFAISSNMAKRVMTQLINNGTIKRGYLGIGLQEIDKEIAEAYKLDKPEGVIITEVIKDSGADKAGLKEGDILMEYNGKPIKSMGAFRSEIATLEPKAIVELTILREGKKQKYKVELGTHPQEVISAAKVNQLGFEVSDIKGVKPEILRGWGYQDIKEGVIITTVKSSSQAAKAGLRPGMIILQANGQKITTGQDFDNVLQNMCKNKTLTLLIRYVNVNKMVIIRIQ